jgi:hypothetical protein
MAADLIPGILAEQRLGHLVPPGRPIAAGRARERRWADASSGWGAAIDVSPEGEGDGKLR